MNTTAFVGCQTIWVGVEWEGWFQLEQTIAKEGKFKFLMLLKLLVFSVIQALCVHDYIYNITKEVIGLTEPWICMRKGITKEVINIGRRLDNQSFGILFISLDIFKSHK